MGISDIKSYFKLYDLSELSPEQRFKSKAPQYFWHGCESEVNSRATTPAGSRRNSFEKKTVKKPTIAIKPVAGATY